MRGKKRGLTRVSGRESPVRAGRHSSFICVVTGGWERRRRYQLNPLHRPSASSIHLRLSSLPLITTERNQSATFPTVFQRGKHSPTDPYNASDPSPTSSNAIASSCWELAALQTHYLSSVSTLAKIFTEVFTKPQFNMEDFLDHGYGTVGAVLSLALSRTVQ